jgi:hypothetical protein
VWGETSVDVNAVADNGYITTSSEYARVTVTLPSSPSVGNVVRVAGIGTDGWKVAQPANTIINFGLYSSTSGTSGYLQSTDHCDAIELVCVIATIDNYQWNVISSVGNITIA